MRATAAIVAAAVAAGLVAAAGPADAKTCKARVTAAGIVTSQGDSRAREVRARRGALAMWRSRAQRQYGLSYRFWSRADHRKEACYSSKGRSRCLVSAKPCRLL